MFALAVAGFPREMSKAIVSEVFRGGRDKVAEAGGVIAAGIPWSMPSRNTASA